MSDIETHLFEINKKAKYLAEYFDLETYDIDRLNIQSIERIYDKIVTLNTSPRTVKNERNKV